MNNISLFKRLSAVTYFSVSAKAETHWQAVGEGVVKICKPDQQTVIWEETGQWDSTVNNLEFSNSYRWNLVNQNAIHLEHLRYGKDHPVHLVNIQCQQDGSWRSIEPHQCGQDSYQLDLKIQEKYLILNWRIQGPKKNQISIICYR